MASLKIVAAVLMLVGVVLSAPANMGSKKDVVLNNKEKLWKRLLSALHDKDKQTVKQKNDVKTRQYFPGSNGFHQTGLGSGYDPSGMGHGYDPSGMGSGYDPSSMGHGYDYSGMGHGYDYSGMGHGYDYSGMGHGYDYSGMGHGYDYSGMGHGYDPSGIGSGYDPSGMGHGYDYSGMGHGYDYSGMGHGYDYSGMGHGYDYSGMGHGYDYSGMGHDYGHSGMGQGYDYSDMGHGYDYSGMGHGYDPSGMGHGYDPSGMGTGYDPSGMATGYDPSGMATGYDPSGMGHGTGYPVAPATMYDHKNFMTREEVINFFYDVVMKAMDEAVWKLYEEERCQGEIDIGSDYKFSESDTQESLFQKMEISFRDLITEINMCSGEEVHSQKHAEGMIQLAELVYKDYDQYAGVAELEYLYEMGKQEAMSHSDKWSEECRLFISALDCNMEHLHEEMVNFLKK